MKLNVVLGFKITLCNPFSDRLILSSLLRSHMSGEQDGHPICFCARHIPAPLPLLIFRVGSCSSQSRGTLTAQIALARHAGLNTIRLEGKMESGMFYSLMDSAGMLALPGW
jgi:hypothetical protein